MRWGVLPPRASTTLVQGTLKPRHYEEWCVPLPFSKCLSQHHAVRHKIHTAPCSIVPGLVPAAVGLSLPKPSG
jgi:hypothetical protein